MKSSPQKDVFPEDLIDIVDNHALVPVYSFLTEEDQEFVIKKVHSEQKTSVVMVDEIKEDLANHAEISKGILSSCANFGMLHSYSHVYRYRKKHVDTLELKLIPLAPVKLATLRSVLLCAWGKENAITVCTNSYIMR
ncbi:MAG: hypothetical protein MZU95_16895 [Desulfomicrobium escambiense]|nr:hypothetical protein [Desulfomicrobium escambiense]